MNRVGMWQPGEHFKQRAVSSQRVKWRQTSGLLVPSGLSKLPPVSLDEVRGVDGEVGNVTGHQREPSPPSRINHPLVQL